MLQKAARITFVSMHVKPRATSGERDARRDELAVGLEHVVGGDVERAGACTGTNDPRSSCKLQAPRYKFQATNHKPQATSYKLQASEYKGGLERAARHNRCGASRR